MTRAVAKPVDMAFIKGACAMVSPDQQLVVVGDSEHPGRGRPSLGLHYMISLDFSIALAIYP